MYKLIALTALSILLFVSQDSITKDPLDGTFRQWMELYGKSYSPEQELYRAMIFAQNYQLIQTHNSQPDQTYQMKETQFMDLSQEEFRFLYLTSFVLPDQPQPTTTHIPTPQTGVDWRGITKVKQQGNCGGCWAFSAVGATESYYYVKQGVSVELSEQQLIDCDPNSFGCDGGYHNLALKYIQMYGITTAAKYPYKGRNQSCKQISGEFKISNVSGITSSNLQNAVAEYPVATLVDATNWAFYGSGVFSNCQKNVNHAVLLVGYQNDGVWFVKNSWGSTWGEEGYIRLAAGDTCAVSSYAFRAL